MSAAIYLITRAHALIVRLYPHNFRQEFEGEMRTVFSDALADASQQGANSLIGLWWREMRDGPKRLLTEYWFSIAEFWKRRIFMSEIDQSKNWKIEPRRDAIIAALPPLLFGVGVMTSALIVQKPWYEIPSWRLYLGVVIGMAVPAIAVGVGGIIALIRRIPDWGYTWVGSAAMGLALFIQVLAEERAEVGLPILSPFGDIILAALIFLGCVLLLVWVALRSWQKAGLVSIGFASMLGISVISMVTAGPFHRYDLALLAAPFGMLMAWLAYHFALGSTKTRIFVLLGIGGLNLAAVILADSATKTWAFANQRPSFILPLLVLITGVLVSGPILGLIGGPVRRAIKGA